jgi:formylglycine-generating enzyme required for sulfatase activity
MIYQAKPVFVDAFTIDNAPITFGDFNAVGSCEVCEQLASEHKVWQGEVLCPNIMVIISGSGSVSFMSVYEFAQKYDLVENKTISEFPVCIA